MNEGLGGRWYDTINEETRKRVDAERRYAYWYGVGLMRAKTINAILKYERANLAYTENLKEIISHTIDDMVQELIKVVAALVVTELDTPEDDTEEEETPDAD